MALAIRCGLHDLLATRLTLAGKGAAKITALVAGMVGGADCIDDMDLLRHGGMPRLFDQVRAKQGTGRGYSGVTGLNALLAVLSTPASAPVLAATRLRKGSTNSARGAAKPLADALAAARRCGAVGLLLVRADSAYYGFDIINACRRAGARFSVTARLTPTMVAAITAIPDTAWTPIRYPRAIYDEDEQRWASDAEVAETGFTAFTSRRKAEHVTARLIARRVRRLNPGTAPAGQGRQGELFAAYRYHAAFTDNGELMLAAEATHRDHAIVEQVIAELKQRPTRPPPLRGVHRQRHLADQRRDRAQPHSRGRCLAGGHHARSRTQTPRHQLIDTSARLAHSAHQQFLHLPADRPWEPGLDQLFRRATHDPLPIPARPPPAGPDRRPQWNSRTDRQLNHAHPSQPQPEDQLDVTGKINGGSRISHARRHREGSLLT